MVYTPHHPITPQFSNVHNHRSQVRLTPPSTPTTLPPSPPHPTRHTMSSIIPQRNCRVTLLTTMVPGEPGSATTTPFSSPFPLSFTPTFGRVAGWCGCGAVGGAVSGAVVRVVGAGPGGGVVVVVDHDPCPLPHPHSHPHPHPSPSLSLNPTLTPCPLPLTPHPSHLTSHPHPHSHPGLCANAYMAHLLLCFQHGHPHPFHAHPHAPPPLATCSACGSEIRFPAAPPTHLPRRGASPSPPIH